MEIPGASKVKFKVYGTRGIFYMALSLLKVVTSTSTDKVRVELLRKLRYMITIRFGRPENRYIYLINSIE